MSLDTLKAFTFDLVAFGCTLAVINPVGLPSRIGIRNSITNHQFMALDSILHGNVAFHLPWVLLLESIPSSQDHCTFTPSLASTLYPATSNHLSTALETIICSRPGEVAQFQTCDFWPDFHTGYGIPGYEGTTAFNIKRKRMIQDVVASLLQ